MNLENARQKLEEYGQLHVLDHYEELTDEQKEVYCAAEGISVFELDI